MKELDIAFLLKNNALKKQIHIQIKKLILYNTF